MEPIDSGLVDIARDFLAAHALATRIAARYRAGELGFDEVPRLVGNDEDAALFRLKERCHALFRDARAAGAAASREALFDLVVGALFHEAMKFRENLYQRSVYGPKVRALRAGASDASESALFDEFEKILAATSVRLDESLQETETLLEQARRQLRRLLAGHRENGLVARYLVEHPALVDAVFPEGDGLLAEIHGSTADGLVCAARSYLASGHCGEAERALAEARKRAPEASEPRALASFASGMRAHSEGRHADALEELAAWLDAVGAARDARLDSLAWSALSRLAERPPGGERGIAERAQALAERVAPQAPPRPARGGARPRAAARRR
jgi:hypothetical protein